MKPLTNGKPNVLKEEGGSKCYTVYIKKTPNVMLTLHLDIFPPFNYSSYQIFPTPNVLI